MSSLELETRHGLARVHLRLVAEPRGAVVLGHGAGGGVGAPDLVAATGAAGEAGFHVALVEQPYRVAGRRSPAPAAQLDAAWTDAVAALCSRELAGCPLVTGGRSSGARVACRTAAATGAVGVICLAFPLVPPHRAGGRPAPSRLPELDAVGLSVLVVQGRNDRFGMPPPAPRRTVIQVDGDHALRSAGAKAAVHEAVRAWLPSLAD